MCRVTLGSAHMAALAVKSSSRWPRSLSRSVSRTGTCTALGRGLGIGTFYCHRPRPLSLYRHEPLQLFKPVVDAHHPPAARVGAPDHLYQEPLAVRRRVEG